MWSVSRMWFEDLTPYTYIEGPDIALIDEEEPRWKGRTLNVGWLDGDRPYTTGSVPGAMMERLRELVAHARTQQTRGFHGCDLCSARCETEDEPPDTLEDWFRSSAEIRVMGMDGTRYAAPVALYHYVKTHRYCPPPAFITAVLYSRRISWTDALEKELCLSCGSLLEAERIWEPYNSDRTNPTLKATMACPGCQTRYYRPATQNQIQRMGRPHR
jgi:hypothetical protein